MTSRLDLIQEKVIELSNVNSFKHNLKEITVSHNRSIDGIIVIYLYMQSHLDELVVLLNNHKKIKVALKATTERLINKIVDIDTNSHTDENRYPKNLIEICLQLLNQLAPLFDN